MPDATIIGGGPAGSLAGWLLARAGWDITLIEQHPFPRDKVCGECLSALGITVLKRAGLADRLLDAHPAILTHTALYARDGQAARLKLAEPMWGLSRSTLDSTLLYAAAEACVDVRQPARCELLEPGHPPRLVFRDLRTNQQETTKPTFVLLADGKGALLRQRPAPTSDFGIKAHFIDVHAPPDTIELFSVHEHYGGVSAIERDRWNVAFSIPTAELQRTKGDLDGMFAEILGQNVELRRQFKAARRAGGWLAAPLPRFPINNTWPDGIIPLGNAAAALEPIGGEGMGLALRSAELAVQMLLNDPSAVRPLRTSFKNLWRIRRPACRLAAKMLSSPTLAGPTIELLARNNSIGGLALKFIGK
jgi:2-polyprenyl-6-methoxyphenol hydroxylase-like FAD-dependent oxidoreductase